MIAHVSEARWFSDIADGWWVSKVGNLKEFD